MVFTRDFLLIINEDVVIGDVVDVDSQLYELFELFGISISFSTCGGSENTSSFKLISFELIIICWSLDLVERCNDPVLFVWSLSRPEIKFTN